MFSLLLNIYAKWHPEMFNPYLRGSPRGLRGWRGGGGEATDRGGEVRRLQFQLVVKHRRWPLASGPGRETWPYCCCWKKCASSRVYYMLSVVLRELDTRGGRAERFYGALASAEGSKIKGKEKTWGGRWTRERKEKSTYCTLCTIKESCETYWEERERNKSTKRLQ